MFNQFNVQDKWYTYTDKIMSVSGELFVENDVDISGNLQVSNNVDISGNLDVNGDASFGNVDISGNLTVNNNATINGITIGNVYPNVPGWYGIRNSNITNPGNEDFALVQNENGHTVINSSSGQQIDLQINNSSKLIVNSNGSINLANLAIGNIDNSTSTTATVLVSHRNHLNVNSYALLQNNSGDTVVNAASGQKIYFRINNSTDDIDVNSNGFFMGSGGKRIEWKNGDYNAYIRSDHLSNIGQTIDFYIHDTLKWRFKSNSSSAYVSDDRLKHNEITINNGLELINRLNPQIYDKTDTFREEDYNGPLEEGSYYKESGFIAQEVYAIDELRFLVSEPNDETEPYMLNYIGIIPYNTAGIKELHSLVQDQQIQINTLTSENTLLKSKLNEILSEMGKETI